MSSKANYFKLGSFVIAGALLGLGALLAMGVGRSLKKPLLLETYLDQSVQGLEVGSTVRYRGVQVGTVHTISFSRDRYEYGKPAAEQKSYILIEVAVADYATQPHGRAAFLDQLQADVARGLRFRLNAQGITGLSYLELDFVDPERNPPLPVSWTPENPYVPSAPGTLTKLLSAVEQVFRKLEDVDLERVLTNLNRLLSTTEAEIRGAGMSRVAEQATNLLLELRATNESLQSILAQPKWRELPVTAHTTLEALRERVNSLDLRGSIERLEAGLSSAQAFFAGKEPDLAVTLANLRAISENLRAITEAARAYPAGFLLGAPPPRVQPAPAP